MGTEPHQSKGGQPIAKGAKWADDLAKRYQDDSRVFLDMPMTGGRMAAERSGQLTLLAG